MLYYLLMSHQDLHNYYLFYVNHFLHYKDNLLQLHLYNQLPKQHQEYYVLQYLQHNLQHILNHHYYQYL